MQKARSLQDGPQMQIVKKARDKVLSQTRKRMSVIFLLSGEMRSISELRSSGSMLSSSEWSKGRITLVKSNSVSVFFLITLRTVNVRLNYILS